MFDLYHIGSVGRGELANDLIQRGRVGLFDIRKNQLVTKGGEIGTRNQRQIIQIDYTRNNREWMSKEFPSILKSFSHPLHFIDFETTALAVPYHADMHPHEPVAFQWSCHTLEKPGGGIKHSEWINAEDVFPNFKFAESLEECVGTSGTVFMWASHENTILSTILRQMTERGYQNGGLVKWLNNIVRTKGQGSGRLVDMNQLTVKHYFHPLMKGKTSIKVVSDAVWQTDPELRKQFPEYLKQADEKFLGPYEALPPLEISGTMVSVAEGTGAIQAYEAMVYGLERDNPETVQTWKKLLLQYCKLDTLSMYFVWRHWQRVTES